MAPSETDFQPVVTRVIAAKGHDGAVAWATALKDNAKVYDSNESLITAVNRGEVAMGMVDHYYWYRLRDEVGAGNVHSALTSSRRPTRVAWSTSPAPRCSPPSQHRPWPSVSSPTW